MAQSSWRKDCDQAACAEPDEGPAQPRTLDEKGYRADDPSPD